MKLWRNQAGMSMPGILAILAMLGFFVMCAIRMTPPYFEYLSIKNIILQIVLEPEAEDLSTSTIRKRIATNFNTNQIYGLNPREVEVYRKKGKTYIDASYEVRQAVLWRIDSVLKFDDLHFAVGDDQPITEDPRAGTK